ncbi:LOW QUALITY PROTEIN: ALMT domain-containing protein, partial [Cephalotus follicularis]
KRMAQEEELNNTMEERIEVADGSSEILVPQAGSASSAWIGIKVLIAMLALKVWTFLKKTWDLAVDDCRKVIHWLKVAMALTLVSLFYYMRPLYDGVAGNVMWAVMTVVVVFVLWVSATPYKGLNRVFATSLAGFLAIGVHLVASQSGEDLQPLIVGVPQFLFASAITFSRYIPVKDQFDYGATIFILTFSLVAVSGYQVDKLFVIAHERISTIIIGTSLCIAIIMLVCPIWAGEELHNLITANIDKLDSSLDGRVAEYFTEIRKLSDDNEDESPKKLLGYRCVLSSKATEDSMANFARWEPAHGHFNFRHPWKQYLKMGALTRNCAYCIEALNSCINAENQVPDFLKKHLSTDCLGVSSNSSSAMREIKTMKKSSAVDMIVGKMNSSVQEVQNDLESLSSLYNPQSLPEAGIPESSKPETDSKTAATIPLLEIIPVLTFASLVMKIATRIEAIVDAIEELTNLDEFEIACHEIKTISPYEQKDEKTMITLQRV